MNIKRYINLVPAISLLKVFTDVAKAKEQEGNRRTAANYYACINKISVYLNTNAGKFSLQELNPEWVAGFVDWLRRQHPGKPQTVDFYFRNMRAMSNHVLNKRKLKWEADVNPFKETSVKGVQHSKRALPESELLSLLDPSLREKLTSVEKEALDILLFILYARGMVFQDVYNLTWKMVTADGHIQYLRSKTQYPIDVEISEEAREIMERYRSEDSVFVFPFLHVNQRNSKKRLSEESALRRTNKMTVIIGRKAGTSIALTTYVMRHTWATLMVETGKPVELISQCLGHASIGTTQIYLSRISVNRVDHEVNDMVNQMLRRKNTIESLKKTSLEEKENSAALNPGKTTSWLKRVLFSGKKENRQENNQEFTR